MNAIYISNLPYNVSSQILIKSVLNNTPNKLILMFQRVWSTAAKKT